MPSASLELSTSVGECLDYNPGTVADGVDLSMLVTGTPTHGERLHTERERRGVRLTSNYAMALGVAGVLLVLIWTSMTPTLEMQGTWSGTSESTQRET